MTKILAIHPDVRWVLIYTKCVVESMSHKLAILCTSTVSYTLMVLDISSVVFFLMI